MKQKRQNKEGKPVGNKVEPDEKDIAILRLLQANARISVKEISEKVHLSATPVHERIRRLEAAGIIQQYATLLNAAKLGKALTVICYVSLRQHDQKAGAAFIDAIHELHEVTECYSISGEFDFMLKVLAADMADYYNFHVNKLSRVENIGHVQSIFVMGVVKQSYKLV